MGRACSTHGEKRNAYRVPVGKPEGERPLGRPRHRWEDNIKMDLSQIGWGGMNWIHLVQDRDQWRTLVNTVMKLRVPYMLGNSWVAERLAASQGLSSMKLVSGRYTADDGKINEYGAVSEMTIGRGNRSTRRKPAPVPLSPPKIPYGRTLCLKLHSRSSVGHTYIDLSRNPERSERFTKIYPPNNIFTWPKQ
jgi:hypothetical protein